MGRGVKSESEVHDGLAHAPFFPYSYCPFASIPLIAVDCLEANVILLYLKSTTGKLKQTTIEFLQYNDDLESSTPLVK